MVDEGDQQLPIANVGRIMKNILPPTAKISKGAKERMQECVTEFISFVTGEASDKCHKENPKTVNGDDICWALSSLGFDNYAEGMTRYLHRYRELEREKAASQGKCTEASYLPCSSTDIHHKDQIAANNITQGSERPAIMPLEFRIIDHNKGKTSSFT